MVRPTRTQRTRVLLDGALTVFKALVLPAFLLGAFVFVFGAGACEDGTPSPTDGGVGQTGRDAGVDASPSPAAIRCTDEELAAGTVAPGGTPLEVTFNTGANPKQYENRCATVKVGASVAFSGSFLQHPLEPAGGDSPSPIPYTAADPPGQRLVVTFPDPGTFGFQCEFHPTSMFGAIRVVP
jgi:plastocyanin